MNAISHQLGCFFAAWLIAAFLAPTAPSAEPDRADHAQQSPNHRAIGPVELLRDSWGIPHVFSETDAGAFYGLGYATAEDRAFQMTYSLRIIQGRLAEVIGEVKKPGRDETSVDEDRWMRTAGFYRAARRTAANLDPETRMLLAAYCQGVNDYFAEHKGELHPLFAELGLEPEPWTPADCLASWWHLGQFFATDGTHDLIARRSLDEPSQQRGGRAAGRGAGRIEPPTDLEPMPPDEGPAVVKRSDVPAEWIQRVEKHARDHGLVGNGDGSEGKKFSHAWVVGGSRTSTGSSVLVSDPQTPVRNPSLFYEFHIQGKTFNARGIGVPGSPALLIGFTEHVAWGLTALGADQADLFLLDTDPAHPDRYRFDGQWRPMTVHRETIQVKGREPIPWIVRETHLGPVATEFCYAQPDDGEVAIKRVPICETDRETIQGAIAMMRARDAREFDAALVGWRFPSANIVFGDRQGNIGYRALAAIPVRSRQDPAAGRAAMPGHISDQDWQEILPHDLLPGVMNPSSGFLYSGNHRPIESWYPIPLGAMTGAGGDTVRSWRLRERLEAQQKFTPEDVRAIHFDTVNPARRDIVRIGLHLRDVLKQELSEDASRALARLEPWYRAGASSSLGSPGAETAMELSVFFRFVSTDLAFAYGGGESGLTYFLKIATARIDGDAKAEFSQTEQDFIDQSLATAWRSSRQKYGDDPADWNAKARQAVRQRKLGYYEGLDGFPSLDSAEDLSFPALSDVDGGTIASQASQSYTQWVPMHDPDQAMSVLPIGQSEQPGSRSRTSTFDLWAEGKLHPAPLSRAAVEKLAGSRRILEPPDQSAATYTNPVIPGTDLADPSVILYDGTYYLYATGDCRGYDVYTSTDLVRWTKGPRVFDSPLPMAWAPDVYRHSPDGKFYLYYTADRKIGIAVADRPDGKFKDQGICIQGAIDAHLFADDDGSLYLYYVKLPGFRIHVQRMSSPLAMQGEPRQVLEPTEPWEMKHGRVTEGPWMLKSQGRYYLIYSGSGANGPDYAIGYAVSDSPTGPFTKHPGNPIAGRSDNVFGPGHGCIISDPAGNLWHVYHQKESPNVGWGRFVCIDPMWFDDDGNLHSRATRGVPQPAPASRTP